ncbi:MAG: hypothetical protein HOO96_08020 [Polyangiaceae bacterium]|nr:hypothetical protein [Polyangiaceae bacterium]
MDAEIACDRASGSTDHPAGRGCAAADLCSVGWHVCKNGAELSAQNGDCGTLEADGFFATQQPASGGVCAGGGNDDVFGCMRGAVGANLANAVCQPLNAVMSTTTALPGWNLGTNPINERLNATKQNLLGGVLCCKG